MKNILIGIPSVREDEKFIDSLELFHQAIAEYPHECVVIKNEKLADAQNRITEIFIDSNFDYLLFLDDDHYGHTKEMLDCLINANAYVATMKTYSRHYPYQCTLMKKIGLPQEDKRLAGIEQGEGYLECDMTGFAMTLIRRDLFDRIQDPYFRPQENGGTEWATDREFFERLSGVGIKPVGCFQYCLSHADVSEENVLELRSTRRHDEGNDTLFRLFMSRQGA